MFNKDSQLVKNIISLIDKEEMTLEEVPDIYNLKEVIDTWYQ